MWSKLKISIVPRWQRLNHVQRWYFLATFSLLLWLLTFTTAEVLYQMFVVMLLVATTVDIWQSASKIWHTLPGKVLLLASYAILANFCYAYAESQLNSITGIKPDLTPFSVHMMIALQAPIWTFILSMLMSIAYLAVHTGKVFLMLLIRPVSKVHAEMMHQESYPFISLFMRILYLPAVLVFVSLGLQGYMTGDTGAIVQMNNGGVYIKADDAPEKSTKPEASSLSKIDPRTIKTKQEKSSENDQEDLQSFSGVPSIPWANKLVAAFLYSIESQSKSHCKISPPEHAVQINDFEILVIIPDKTQELGYQFTVRGCNSVNLPKILQLDTPSH